MNIKYFLLVLSLTMALAPITCAQQTTTPYPKDQWGKLSKDKLSYITTDGKLQLKVGDTIKLRPMGGMHFAAREKHDFQTLALNLNQEPITGDYLNKQYKIDKIIEGLGETFDGPKVMYMYIILSKTLLVKVYAEIRIEQSLAVNEFQLVH